MKTLVKTTIALMLEVVLLVILVAVGLVGIASGDSSPTVVLLEVLGVLALLGYTISGLFKTR